jgi:hypothetical protein
MPFQHDVVVREGDTVVAAFEVPARRVPPVQPPLAADTTPAAPPAPVTDSTPPRPPPR